MNRWFCIVPASLVLSAAGVFTGCAPKGEGMSDGTVAAPAQYTIPRLKERGDHFYASSRYAEAAEMYEAWIERDPGNYETRLSMARTMLKLGEPEKARIHAEVAYTNDQYPNTDEALTLLAQSMLESGNVDGMTRLLRTVAEGRGLVSDWLRLGDFLSMAKDADEAETAYLTAARVDGGRSLGPQMALADFYEREGETEAALDRLRMALYLDPTNVEIQERIRSMGEVPGPTIRLQPAETRFGAGSES